MRGKSRLKSSPTNRRTATTLRLLVALGGAVVMWNGPFALVFLFKRTEDTADKLWAPEQHRRRIVCSLQVVSRRHGFLVDILVLGL